MKTISYCYLETAINSCMQYLKNGDKDPIHKALVIPGLMKNVRSHVRKQLSMQKYMTSQPHTISQLITGYENSTKV